MALPAPGDRGGWGWWAWRGIYPQQGLVDQGKPGAEVEGVGVVEPRSKDQLQQTRGWCNIEARILREYILQ